MSIHSSNILAVLLAICFALLIPGLFWFHAYTGLPRKKGLLALFASVLVGVLYVTVPMLESRGRLDFPRGNENWVFLSFAATTAAIVFLTALVLRLWGRWVGDKATAEEREPGMPGVRAWFSAANIIVGGFLILTLSAGFDYPALLITVLVGAALAAYPLLRMESPAAAPLPVLAPVPDDLSPEREKILAMLEAGKLTPDESAELLQALRQTLPTLPRQMPLTEGQRLMLIGAALVGLGFFLPWLVINPGKEAGRMMSQMQSTMTSSFRGHVSFPDGAMFSDGQIKTPTMTISGGDIQRGLGWAALAFALIAALLPYIATTLDAATTRTVRLLSLGVGGVIVLYLLTQNLRFVGIGLVMAVGGYVLEAVGVLRERRAAGVSRAA